MELDTDSWISSDGSAPKVLAEVVIDPHQKF